MKNENIAPYFKTSIDEFLTTADFMHISSESIIFIPDCLLHNQSP